MSQIPLSAIARRPASRMSRCSSRSVRILAAALITCAALAPPAMAERDYFTGPAGDDLTLQLDRPRTAKQRLIIAALGGGTALFGLIGLGFHLDSQSAAAEVSASDFTGRVYTPELDATRDRALRSRNLAIAGYAVSGALLVSTVVALIVTEPGTEIVTLRAGGGRAVPIAFQPVPGGALVGAGWSF